MHYTKLLTKSKDSLYSLAMLHLIGQSLVVVKECLVRLPTIPLLLWGNFSRDRLLQKAYWMKLTPRPTMKIDQDKLSCAQNFCFFKEGRRYYNAPTPLQGFWESVAESFPRENLVIGLRDVVTKWLLFL